MLVNTKLWEIKTHPVAFVVAFLFVCFLDLVITPAFWKAGLALKQCCFHDLLIIFTPSVWWEMVHLLYTEVKFLIKVRFQIGHHIYHLYKKS